MKLHQIDMFSNAVQSSTISLFSSTGSSPFQLFSRHVDGKLPEDSFIHLLNDASSTPAPPSPCKLIKPSPIASDEDMPDDHAAMGRTLCQTVLHIQSPTIRATYIRCPPISRDSPQSSLNVRGLGIKHSWMHLQVRNLGREWSFEVGVVDPSGKEGVIRCSTFQVRCTRT